jgi:hypothetical protein
MAIAGVLYRRSVAAVAFEIVWLLLGVASVAQGWMGLRDPRPMLESARNSYGIVISFGALSLALSITHLIRGRLFCLVGGSAGALLGLYGAALILLGHEDVGGLRVALPTGLASIALATWTIIRALQRAREGRVDVA